MKITKETLFADLIVAFHCAKLKKGRKSYIKEFEDNLVENIKILRDELFDRKYVAQPSTCFLVDHPKLREIFAADFRDRIVHHLIFNYVHKLFENTFIYDSYSCIKNRGTHFGIKRMAKHIRACSNNYKNPCYIMKLDITGYFMHIDRQLLYDIIEKKILKMKSHEISKGIKWEDCFDVEFVLYLIKEVVMLDPTKDCIVKGLKDKWNLLPKSKSLFFSGEGKGLPIGNLTSQLFSNVYLNEFDQYVKRELKCKYYGRYVDDSFIIHNDKKFLHAIEPLLESFLKSKLKLTLNKGKTRICKAKQGVEFLGAYIKPNRDYISNQSLKRMQNQIQKLKNKSDDEIFASVNSFLGVLCHYKTYNFRKEMVEQLPYRNFSTIDEDYLCLKRYDWILPTEKKEIIENFIKNKNFS